MFWDSGRPGRARDGCYETRGESFKELRGCVAVELGVLVLENLIRDSVEQIRSDVVHLALGRSSRYTY